VTTRVPSGTTTRAPTRRRTPSGHGVGQQIEAGNGNSYLDEQNLKSEV
jgi:hypothetical protein